MKSPVDIYSWQSWSKHSARLPTPSLNLDLSTARLQWTVAQWQAEDPDWERGDLLALQKQTLFDLLSTWGRQLSLPETKSQEAKRKKRWRRPRGSWATLSGFQTGSRSAGLLMAHRCLVLSRLNIHTRGVCAPHSMRRKQRDEGTENRDSPSTRTTSNLCFFCGFSQQTFPFHSHLILGNVCFSSLPCSRSFYVCPSLFPHLLPRGPT